MKPEPAAPRPTRPAPQAPPRWERWLALLLRLCAIALGAWIAVHMPLPVLEDWLPVRDVLVVLAAIGLA
ncbi:MAG TPA: hypothetical protein VFU47_07725, partial [Armatimonadota bacterium]|nr:hypothetical protein [Armatimonadota bacterium]